MATLLTAFVLFVVLHTVKDGLIELSTAGIISQLCYLKFSIWELFSTEVNKVLMSTTCRKNQYRAVLAHNCSFCSMCIGVLRLTQHCMIKIMKQAYRFKWIASKNQILGLRCNNESINQFKYFRQHRPIYYTIIIRSPYRPVKMHAKYGLK